MAGHRISITHRDHIVFLVFEFNDVTIIMHTNTLYFSFMKPIKNAVHEGQLVLTPEHWMLDFEVAAQ